MLVSCISTLGLADRCTHFFVVAKNLVFLSNHVHLVFFNGTQTHHKIRLCQSRTQAAQLIIISVRRKVSFIIRSPEVTNVKITKKTFLAIGKNTLSGNWANILVFIDHQNNINF